MSWDSDAFDRWLTTDPENQPEPCDEYEPEPEPEPTGEGER